MVDITRTVTPAGKEKVSPIAFNAELEGHIGNGADVVFYVRTTHPITLQAGNLLEVLISKEELRQLVR